MHRVPVLLAALGAASVHGQSFLYSIGGGIGDDSLTSNCGSTFQAANSTGYFHIQPNVAQLPQANQPDNNSGYTRPVEVGVTVVTGGSNLTQNAIQWSIWYSTTGANYSDDFGLGYDVCAFTIGAISTNTLLRGQTDTGNCLATFDSDCVSALTSAASGYANGLIINATPNPDSNLTSNSLSRVCYDVGQALEDNFPSECQKYMNDTVQLSIGGWPLTDRTHSTLYNGCDLTNAENNNEFHLLYTLNAQIPVGQFKPYYAFFNWEVLPAMLTFMPVANINAPQSISSSVSNMACLRASNLNPGSVTPLAAPAPTPLGSGGLSGGAIAGIVVGVVVGLALIAGGAFWFWRRRRAQRKQASTEAPAADQPPAYADAKEQQTPMAEVPADSGIKELSPENEVRPELHTQKSGPEIELPADSKPKLERGNTDNPIELQAEVPNSASPSS